MTRFQILAVTAILGMVLNPSAVRGEDTKAVEANRALATAFESAWNTHDMEVAFRKLLTADVDWVNVDGYRGAGNSSPGACAVTATMTERLGSREKACSHGLP